MRFEGRYAKPMSEATSPGERLMALREEYKSLDEQVAALQRRQAEIKNLIAETFLALPSKPTAAPASATAQVATPVPLRPTDNDSARGDRLVALLRQNRGAPQKWLSEKLYGDPKATGRVSSLLDYLRKTGKARTYARGKWEAVP